MEREMKFVVLERIRCTVNLLKKSNVSNELVSNGKPVLSLLKELQSFLRYNDLDQLEDGALIRPFLHILSSRTISGPYVRNAVDAIQAFLSGNVILGRLPEAISETLRHIASSVISCKFIHTDIAGDELVQLQLIQTLRCLLSCPAAAYLSDQTQWNIVEFCCLTMAKTGGQSNTMLLYQAAERTVHDAMAFLLSMTQRQSASTSTDCSFVQSSGIPCLCRWLEYAAKVLTDAAGAGVKVDISAASTQRSATPPVHHRNISQGSASPMSLNEASCDKATLHVLFVLKVIKSMLSNPNHALVVKQLFTRSKEFSRLFGDDLGFALLQLSGGSAGNPSSTSGHGGSSTPGRSGSSGALLGQHLLTQGSPVVLAAVLAVFEAMLHVVGPCLRILVEAFARQVYLRALMQTYGLFVDQLQFLNEGVEVVSPMVKILNSSSSSAATHGDGGFRLDEIEAILESLSDLFAEPSLLGSWFVSFDCGPASADLVQPLVEYISRCSSLAWTFSADFMSGYFKETGTLVTQLFRQVCKTLHGRSEKRTLPVTAAYSDSERSVSIANLMSSCRGAKHILSRASELFIEKPEKGLKYLQERGSLPTPLTPESVAAFLRLAPDLPKETAGAFLGELGRVDATYEANTVEFHRLVLHSYVESFEFADQSVLDCMRIFLSAFRLPGESQQIDRILVAFSDHCYSQCLEGRQGILENSDVTYVLTFAIIMLNTDRHNPNVRADRRMTLDQFVRTNTNYGRDANQTIPLEREFLASIFTSIDEFQIRTEGKELAAVITSEVWTDLQMQARADPRRAVLVTTQRCGTLHRDILAGSASADEDKEALDNILREVSPAEAAHCIVTPASIVRRLLSSKQRSASVIDPLILSMEIAGQHDLFDGDMLGCLWLDLLRVCLSVHVHNYIAMEQILASELMDQSQSYFKDTGFDHTPTMMKHSQLRKIVSTTNAQLMELLNTANNHKLHGVLNFSNLVLLMCAGMAKGAIADKLTDFLCWDSATETSLRNVPSSESAMSCSRLTVVEARIMIYQFRHFESARLAVSTLLSVVHHNQQFISHWSLVWFLLGGLRDCAMLPKEMIDDPDADLLPPNIREEFENVLIEMDKRTFDQNRPTQPKRVRRQSSSILSLQGLGEVFFGSSVESGEAGAGGSDSPTDADSQDCINYSAEVSEYKHLFKLDALSARWDTGYEASSSPVKKGTDKSLPPTAPTSAQRLRDSAQSSPTKSSTIPAFSIVDGGATIEDLRTLVASSGIAHLVAESRFLSESSLESMLKSLVCVVECKDEAQRSMAEFAEAALSDIANTAEQFSPTERWETEYFIDDCNACMQGKHSFSSASVAWLEMVLVEVSLRNRDRFQSFWPTLKHHYVRVLCGTSVSLSYVTERRVLGILKICTRMISRDHFSGTILELLGRIFVSSGASFGAHPISGLSQKAGSVVSPRNSIHGFVHSNGDDEDGGYTLAKPHFPPMTGQLLHQLSNQIAASMWRVLTLNVDVLPMLPLEQWQTLFTIIAVSAASGGFAAIKSFESMAWLLHEPRLVAKVPVFCIIGVKPLLCNPAAPLSVSIGAVHLLTHLHGRLEVLIRDDREDYVDCEFEEGTLDGDTPILWESCWTPILRVLGEGITDTRAPVREACAEALCQAILDRHSHAVPAGVLVDILGGIIAPMIVQLRDHLVEEINRSLPGTVTKLLTSKEAASIAQQQWVNVDAGAAQEAQRHHEMGGTESLSASLEDRLASLRVSGGTVSVLMECLSALCRSFLQHQRKLSVYPSFDKLWLCILTVLGNFLDSNLHGTSELTDITRVWDTLDEGTKMLVQDLYAMLGSSRDHLQRMLRALRQEHVFATRPGLLTITRDTIKHFDGCTELLTELPAM